MKYLKLTLIAVSLSAAASAQALTYKFIANDNSIETQLCVLAGSNDKSKLNQVMSNYTKSKRYIANSVRCNDMVISSFASRYNADDTANYLNKYTLPKNKEVDTKVTIQDIASLSMDYDLPEQVITVYVGG